MPAKPHRCRRLCALRRCLFHRTEGTYRQVARDGGWSEGANQQPDESGVGHTAEPNAISTKVIFHH